MYECVHTLEAPGVPIEYTYTSKAGTLTLSANSYAFSLSRGVLFLDRPRITNPQGVVVAQFSSVLASGLDMLRGSDQIIRVRAADLQGRLIRQKDGRFDLQDYLPPSKPSATPIPFDVQIERCELQFVDLSGPSAWTRTVRSPVVKVAGIGQDWVATARAEIPGVGTIDARVDRTENVGLQVAAKTDNLQLSQLLDHLQEMPEGRSSRDLANLHAGSISVSGPIRVFVPEGKKPNIEFRIRGTATDLRYSQYRADSVAFSGLIESAGFKGTADVRVGSNTATFQGSASWSGKPKLAGEVTAQTPGSSSLPGWAVAYLPKGVVYQGGQFEGWVSAGPDSQYQVNGKAEASRVSYSGDTLNGPSVNLSVANGRVTVDIERANYQNQPLTGALAFDTKARTVRGTVSIPKVDLALVANRFGYKELQGAAFVSATLDGPIAKPNVSFLTHGHGSVTLPKQHVLSLGHFEGAGRYENGSLLLDRAYFDTPEGLLTAHGALGSQGNLGLSLTARGILLSSYDQDLGGTANLEATIQGTLKNPHATGRVEAYDIAYQDQTLPAAVANFSVNRDLLRLEDIEAARGTASLTGFAHYRLKSGDLTGTLAIRDVQIGDWLDGAVGALDVPSIDLSGTVSKPIVTATVQGKSLVARGIKLDTLKAEVRAAGTVVTLNDLALSAAGGTLHANGSYDIDDKAGKFTASGAGLTLSQLAPDLSDTVALGGTISGQAEADIKDGKLTHATLDGKLASVSVNNLPVGSGLVQAQTDGKTVTGNAEVGDLERYVAVDDITYDPNSKIVGGTFNLYNLRLENLVSESMRYLQDSPQELKDGLQSASGLLTATGKFSGPVNDPSIFVQSLQATNLAYHGDPMGSLDTTFSRDAHKWTIGNFKLSNGPALVSFTGTIDENGQTEIDGNTDNRFDLSKLGDFDPRLAGVTGTAHLWFSVDGPTKSPHIAASLKADDLLAQPGIASTDSSKNLSINFEKIDITNSNGKDGGIRAAADFSYKGLQGTLTAAIPFEYPFKVAVNSPATATIKVATSDLKEIAALTGGIDAKRSVGSVSGQFDIEGDAKNLTAKGSLDLKADTLAFNSVDDTLKGVEASLTLDPTKLGLTAKASSSRSGSATFDANMPIEGLAHLFDIYKNGGAAALMDRPINGTASIDKVQFKDSFLSDSFAAAGNISADLTLGGTVRAPAIGGQARLTSGDITFKGLQVGTAAPKDFPINPRFDLKLALSGPSRMRSSTADMYVLGDGSLQGSLQYPRVATSLYLDKGTVRLPAALVRLQQGGTVKVNYQTSNIQTTASAVVDLEGNTSVTASRYGDTTDFQRYDITLYITGDMIQPQGLTVKADSDPPDLSQQRIMAILGQADILQNLSTSSRQSEAVSAALGFAVPSLLDPLTSQLAEGIGLDYLNLEYNSFDQASVAFGKALGSGFSVVGSHEISQPPPGFPSRYDLRIVYRPRRLPGAFNRLSFFFGADQDRPWKLGLDYGFRF